MTQFCWLHRWMEFFVLFFYILAKLQESFDKSVILSDEIPYCWSLLRQKMFVYSSCKGSKRQREVVSGFPHCPTALTIWMLCLAPPPSTGTEWAVTRRGPSLFGMEAVCSHSHVFCGLITTVCILLVHVRVKGRNDTPSCNIIQQHNPGPLKNERIILYSFVSNYNSPMTIKMIIFHSLSSRIYYIVSELLSIVCSTYRNQAYQCDHWHVKWITLFAVAPDSGWERVNDLSLKWASVFQQVWWLG